MKISTSLSDGHLTVSLEGELDHHQAKKAITAIEESINSRLPKSCVLDMEKLSFMDSSGIAVILKTYRLMNQISGKICVDNLQKQPLRVLDAAGIDRLIRITESKEA